MEKPVEPVQKPKEPKPCRYCGKLLADRKKHERKCKNNYN